MLPVDQADPTMYSGQQESQYLRALRGLSG